MTHAHASAGAMRIGGSDAATIMGANRWKTLLQLWQEKTGRKPKDDLSEKESVQWGIRLEPIVLKAVLDDLGVPLVPSQQQVWLEEDYRCGYLDYQIDPSHIVEIKTSGHWSESEWEKGIPENVRWQIVHYFALSGASTATVACLVGGQTLYVHTMHRDEAEIEALLRAEQEFYDLMVSDTEPVMIAPPEPVQTYTMDGQVEHLALQYLELSKTEKAVAADKDVVKKALAALVGANREQRSETGLCVSYKHITQTRVDVDALCADNGIDKADYLKTTSFYRLDVKEIK